ncbi:MAG: response regulator [Kofleriaceae bacterium]
MTAAAASSLEAAPLPRVGRVRILIVDDERSFTTALRRVLGRVHDVTVAADGQEALDLIDAGQRFDVIFSDVTMPRMTGHELLDRLVTKDPEMAHHFVFLSGGGSPARLPARLRALGTRELEKPTDIQALREVIREIASEPAPSKP